MLSGSHFIEADLGRHSRHHYDDIAVPSDVLEPGSPQLTEVRCGRTVWNSARVDPDVRLLSGSKRSCEGFGSLQDEAEFEDASMVNGRCSHMMCTSSTTKSLGIKRVCSLASSDGIDMHCQLSQQQQCSVMIPVPGPLSTPQLTAGDVCVHSESLQAAAAVSPAKHNSTMGSSSSREHGSPAASTTAHQEAASHAISVAAGLAPIKTQVCAKGPRLRLGGRLLSPDEAQRHLQAVAAAAAAGSAGRSLSFAHSQPVTCPGRISPDGPHLSGTSLSSGNCMPLADRGAHAQVGACAQSLKSGTAQAGVPPAPASTVGFPSADALPENFIPTPEGVTNWLSLASACDEEVAGVTSRVCSSPSACDSYTSLLMTGDVGPLKTEHMLAPPARGATAATRLHAAAATDIPLVGQVSAFAAPSALAWPIPMQQPADWAPLFPAASMPSACSATTGSGNSCPVVIPQQCCSWSNTARGLGNSGSGSNSSFGSGRLAATLAMQAMGPAQLPAMFPLIPAATDTNQQAHLTAARKALPCMPQQQQHHVAGAAVSNSSSSRTSSFDNLKSSMWKPAFTPPAFLVDDVCIAAASSLVGRPLSDLPAKPVPIITQRASEQQHDITTFKNRWSDGPKKRPGRQASAKKHKQAVQLSAQAPQHPVVVGCPQQVMMSHDELMAVLQENMAAGWASGYMMASSFAVGRHDVVQQHVQQHSEPQRQAPLLKPVATLRPFNMPASALVGSQQLPGDGSGAVRSVAVAASAAAVCANTSKVQAASGQVVDDILPSLQELLTEWY